jgi:hypothetical protein
MRRIVVVGLALCLLGTPSALAKPPSFQRWSDAWLAEHGAWQDRLSDHCKTLARSAPERAGECFVKGLRAYIRREQPKWETAMTRLARGQSASCREALHAYLLASRKSQNANLAYYDAHPHLDFSRISSFLREKPYAGLAAATQHARRRAGRICG